MNFKGLDLIFHICEVADQNDKTQLMIPWSSIGYT